MGRGEEPPPPLPDAPTDGLQAEDHELKLTYRAKSSQGVRMTAGPNALATLPEMLADVSQGRVTVVAAARFERPHGRARTCSGPRRPRRGCTRPGTSRPTSATA